MSHTIGFWRTWGLVVGAAIGSTILMVPTLMVPYGRLGIVSWLFAGGAMLCVALSMGRLARIIPKLGGPYAYTREVFGDLAGFLVAWCYWISCWVGIAAIAISFSGYLGVVLPFETGSTRSEAVAAILFIWVFTALNLAGVGTAAAVNLLLTLLKLVPLVVVGCAGLLLGDLDIIPAPDRAGEPMPLYLSALLILLVGAFVGIEAGCIPADNVREPQRTIPRAMMAGTLSIALVYLLGTGGVMALLPPDQLSTSASPFADAAGVVFGSVGEHLIALGAIVALLGVLNATLLIAAQIARAASIDQLFPDRFAQLNDRGAPAFALLVSSSLATLLVCFSITDGIVAAFNFMLLLGTLTAIVVYVVVALADLYLQLGDYRAGKPVAWRSLCIAGIALLTASAATLGSGLDMIGYTLMLVGMGVPVYYLVKRRVDQ